MSYVVGWLVLVGEIATAAGCAMNNSQTIGALIQLSYPDFELTVSLLLLNPRHSCFLRY